MALAGAPVHFNTQFQDSPGARAIPIQFVDSRLPRRFPLVSGLTVCVQSSNRLGDGTMVVQIALSRVNRTRFFASRVFYKPGTLFVCAVQLRPHPNWMGNHRADRDGQNYKTRLCGDRTERCRIWTDSHVIYGSAGRRLRIEHRDYRRKALSIRESEFARR